MKINSNLIRMFSLILVISLTTVILAACANDAESNITPENGPDVIVSEDEQELESVQESDSELEPVPEPEPEDTGFYNPLTGMATWEDISNNRPIAVMINNVRAGLPQQGTSRADIIYETLVEGGLTRTVAIFQDVSRAGVLGGVRSARLVYVDIAQAHDAILMHAGGSPEAILVINRRDLDTINEIGGPRGRNIFFRDSTRRARLGSEHSLMTSGERITNELADLGFRLEHEADYQHSFEFVQDGTPADGNVANNVTVVFSGAKSTIFVYNAEQNRYYLEQFGRPHLDANDDTQISVTNVIVIRTSISNIPGDDAGRQRIVTEGSGTGYFINGGKYIEINWSRTNVSDPFSFTLSDGSPLLLGVGRTYVCIIPTNAAVNFR